MKWSEFKALVDKELQEKHINGHTNTVNPDILYIDFNGGIEPDDVEFTRLGLAISSE